MMRSHATAVEAVSSSGVLSRILGDKVLIAIERLMGMLLVAIAIQMLMTGVASFASGA